eukprot:1071981-Karenia_brevis.AAC.1
MLAKDQQQMMLEIAAARSACLAGFDHEVSDDEYADSEQDAEEEVFDTDVFELLTAVAPGGVTDTSD